MPKKKEVGQSFQIPAEIPLPKAEIKLKKVEIDKPVEGRDAINRVSTEKEKPKKSIYVKKAAPAPQAPVQKKEEDKSEVYKELEEVLAEGLEGVYLSLDAKEQAEFRRKGEEATSKVEELVVGLRAKARDVLKLIKNWLLVIPKVNKHFLEQESKLRTDKVMIMAKKYKKQNKR